MRAFERQETVRFAHCDPAGIVFFPQYLVMVNTLVEAWFDEGLGLPFAQFVGERRLGLPTVRLEVDFTAISRLGDRLTQRLQVLRAGRSSLELKCEFFGGGELRLRARQVVVCTSLADHRPRPLPEDLRAGLPPFMETL
jgi:4-hydroxybenzoyl-CoA thioesterase